MSATQWVLGGIVALCSVAHVSAEMPALAESDGTRAAFERLVLADHWRDVNKARDDLAGYGQRALPTLVAGTQHEKTSVRES